MSNDIYQALYQHQFKDQNIAKFYLDRYVKFIESRKDRVLKEETYTEKNHILPRSWNGDNSKDNLIKLTAREHFIAHLILYHTKDKSMVTSLWQMIICPQKDKIKRNYIISSLIYENARKNFSDSRKGHEVSEDLRKKLSESHKGKDPWNKGKRHSKESRRKMSISAKGNRNAFGHKCSPEARKKLSEAHKGRDNHQSKKVICLETGKIFESAKAASLWLNLKENAVRSSIFQKSRSGGYHWKYL